MSYYIRTYFKKVESLEEGIKVLNNFIKEYSKPKNVDKIIDEYYTYIYRDLKRVNVEIDKNAEPIVYCDFLKNFFQRLFIFKARYYPAYKLIALCFYDCTDIAYKYFDGMIEFQNSCDQDYDFGTWNVLDDQFKDKAEVFKKMSAEELIQLDGYLTMDDLKDEDFEKNLDYLRKATMYRFVYKKLELEKWFSNDESENNTFITLNMCLPLFDFYDELVVSLTKKFINVLCEQTLLAKLLSDEELFKIVKENLREK